MTTMRVWIDQDLCTGDGLCEEVCPEIFGGYDDGLFYVKETAWPSVDDKGDGKQVRPIYEMAQGMATVPERLALATIEAAEDCPGECIFIEVEDT